MRRASAIPLVYALQCESRPQNTAANRAGVRVIAGERTGYAYSDDLSPAKIRKAAHTAALIAKGPASVIKTGFEESQQHKLYPMLHAPNEMGLDERVALIKRADEAARP